MNKENSKISNNEESYVEFTKNILEVDFGSIGETNWEIFKEENGKISTNEFSTEKEWVEEIYNIENSYDNCAEISSDCDILPERIPFSNANFKKFGEVQSL
ncbi:hypothetical protein H312_00622 [Anncaliia algerae PRA339]|uniref:Uncharacterized protein n=1 Tax=Anncaliia algerae PRA339 TaxID=1288291 RepID=A0A059F4Q7_9MICR|nr:hypothetical protein H312_00622 [Anncaliia algerae PRA339]